VNCTYPTNAQDSSGWSVLTIRDTKRRAIIITLCQMECSLQDLHSFRQYLQFLFGIKQMRARPYVGVRAWNVA
jgi:hypothetical protein